MVSLVDGLLVLARLDRETTADAPPAPVALAPLAQSSLRRHRHLHLDLQESVPDVLVAAQEDVVRRVLDNLLDNAVRHAASSVSLSASQDVGRVTLVVEDDGAGIPPEDRDRVFDRFTRLDDARDRDGGGSGLGLAIVRELVERDEGVVALDDRPGGGLRVSVTLPAAPPAAGEPDAPS